MFELNKVLLVKNLFHVAMPDLIEIFKQLSSKPRSILDKAISRDLYCELDLSTNNKALGPIDITDYEQCQSYIDTVLERNNAKVAYGGYLERRNIYADKSSFSKKGAERNIHLGMDFWAKANTKVLAPLNGEVHSFQNNAAIGDYGPTIILKHQIEGLEFHTLYGHLSLESIQDIQIGQQFDEGAVLATLGTPDINVNYAPHLHFQLIINLEGKSGDYPGVCSEKRLDFYSKNCPNPNFLLNF